LQHCEVSHLKKVVWGQVFHILMQTVTILSWDIT